MEINILSFIVYIIFGERIEESMFLFVIDFLLKVGLVGGREEKVEVCWIFEVGKG